MLNVVRKRHPARAENHFPPGTRSDAASCVDQAIRQHSGWVHGLLAFLVLAVLMAYYVPPLVRMDVYNNDMCEHLSWYQAAANPNLFQHDIIKTYYTAMAPMGFRWLYNSVCAWVQPQVVGETLSPLLGMAGAFLAYKLGRTLAGGSPVGAIAGVLLLLFGHALGLHEFVKVFQGGLQRAFALPILLLGTWALFDRKVWPLWAALIVAALFFPPVCVELAVFSAGVMAVRFFKRDAASPRIFRDCLIVGGACVLSVALLFIAKAVTASYGHWTLYTLKDARTMPEYFDGGVWSAVGSKPLIMFSKWTDYFTQGLAMPAPLLFLGLCAVFFCRAERFRMEALVLAVSALVCWGAAYATLFTMFEPSRYVQYAVMTLWLITVPWAVNATVIFFDSRLAHFMRRCASFGQAFRIGAVVVFVVLVGSAAAWETSWRIQTGQGGMTGTAPPEVYQFLQSLPETTMIAAHPRDGDDIPMRSQRSVLAMLKAMFPYHREFYEETKARVNAILTAMYASNVADILPLKDQFGAGVLVINTDYYNEDPLEMKPFSALLASCRARLHGGTPLVLRLPDDVVLFKKGTFIIIDLSRLERLRDPSPSVRGDSELRQPDCENPRVYRPI